MRPLAILTVVLAMAASPAFAQHHGNFHGGGHGGWHGGFQGRPGGFHHGGGVGDFWSGAIIGGIVGSIFRPAPTVVVPAPTVVVPERSAEWCMERYKSYNPETGVYLGFDGQYHACP